MEHGEEPPSGWSLLRFAILGVGDPPAAVPVKMQLADVSVTALLPAKQEGRDVGALCMARRQITDWPGDPLTIPTAERKEAEYALEIACRLLALERRAMHRLTSPQPALGFFSQDQEAMAALDGAVVQHPWPAFPMVGVGELDVLGDPETTKSLGDRLDGVVMLTEALNAGATVGQFTQLWRFFERAFRAGHTDAAPHLQAFLKSGDWHGFTDAEVAAWLAARNPAVHANRAGDLTMDSDVYNLLGRMIEAAYDVLFNKQTWWTKDGDRREAWRPASGSSDPSGNVFLTAGAPANWQASLPDPFASFPLAMMSVPLAVLPTALWLHADANGARLELRGEGGPPP